MYGYSMMVLGKPIPERFANRTKTDVWYPFDQFLRT